MKNGTKTVSMTVNHIEFRATVCFRYTLPECQTHTDPGNPTEIYIDQLVDSAGTDISGLLQNPDIEETILEQI